MIQTTSIMILKNSTKAYNFLSSMSFKEPPQKLQLKEYIKTKSDRPYYCTQLIKKVVILKTEIPCAKIQVRTKASF